jgi:ribosomal-protein-alanine N-acetyltransferase
MRAIETARLLLEPLEAAHAAELFDVLADPAIYRYLDEAAPVSRDHLRRTYERRAQRNSPDGTELWLNWIVRLTGGPALGYVQATVILPGTAWIAYVLSSRFWGHGYTTEALAAMLPELASGYGVQRFLATVEAENQPSIRVLERLGFCAAAEDDPAGGDLAPTERLFIRGQE